MWSEFGVALSLVLVIEGLIPALSPRFFRKTLFAMAQLDSHSIRISGLTSMALGAIILYLLRH